MSELIKKVRDLENNVNDDNEEDYPQIIKNAKNVAISTLMSNFEQTVTVHAKKRMKDAPLTSFLFGEKVKYGGCYLLDLLIKHDLITSLQTDVDSKHKEENGDQAFKVYFKNIISSANRNFNKYGIYISWDKEKWSDIDIIIEETKSMVIPGNYKNNNNYNRGVRGSYYSTSRNDYDQGRGRGRGRYQGRGRGRGVYSSEDTQARMPTENDEGIEGDFNHE